MECIRLPIKPLSANDAWKINKQTGYLYKTEEYHKYKKDIEKFLEFMDLYVPEGLLMFRANFGISRGDLDNCEKPLLDILEKVYSFNDSLIDDIHVRKHRVTKGCEYIEFGISQLKDHLPLDFEDSPRCTRKIILEGLD